MRRMLLFFLAAIACGFVGGLAVRPAPLHAHTPCVCTWDTGSQWPILDGCVGATTGGLLTCSAGVPGDETCSISGQWGWSPLGNPSCALNSSQGAVWSVNSINWFNPQGGTGTLNAIDTKSCPGPAGSPGPAIGLLVIVWYNTSTSGCNCAGAGSAHTGLIRWWCDGA